MRKPAASEDELRELIRAHKLRVTPARVAVLRVLQQTRRPLTHDEVLREIETDSLDRSTIFRALTQLATARVLRRSDLGDHVWRFSVIAGTSRADFVCSVCGSVIELPGLEIRADNAPHAIERGQIEVRVIGRCNDCL